MPLVKMQIVKGKSDDYKKALHEAVTRTLGECLNIAAAHCVQQIQELSAEDFQTVPPGNDRFTVIEISLFPGRDLEAKKRLYATLALNLNSSLGIGDDLMIMIHEIPKDNWGLMGGRPASELGLGSDGKKS